MVVCLGLVAVGALVFTATPLSAVGRGIRTLAVSLRPRRRDIPAAQDAAASDEDDVEEDPEEATEVGAAAAGGAATPSTSPRA